MTHGKGSGHIARNHT